MVLFGLSVGHNNPSNDELLQGKTDLYLGWNWTKHIVVGLKGLVDQLPLTDMNMPMWVIPTSIDWKFFTDTNMDLEFFTLPDLWAIQGIYVQSIWWGILLTII